VSIPYEEILEGATLPCSAPGARHEQICARLHAAMAASVGNIGGTQLLAPRTKIQVSNSSAICPDLALVTAATGKLWLAAEIVHTGDHHADTVVKKEIYERIRVPRLWMIDPRYDNVEIYHSTEFGLQLKNILAANEILSEKLVPEFQFIIAELFAIG
jgi:Uma2 family endonuclease